MARRLMLILTLTALVGLIAAPAVAAAPPAANIPVDVSGTVATGGAFEGTLTIDRVVRQSGQVFAAGTLTGTLTDALGNVVGTVTNLPVSLPIDVGATTASCEVLDLVLGPVDLDLLGLVVTLDTVHLNISAEQGPGNLLGNLLCAVAGLLDGGLNLNGIARLLNQVLSILA